MWKEYSRADLRVIPRHDTYTHKCQVETAVKSPGSARRKLEVTLQRV